MLRFIALGLTVFLFQGCGAASGEDLEASGGSSSEAGGRLGLGGSSALSGGTSAIGNGGAGGAEAGAESAAGGEATGTGGATVAAGGSNAGAAGGAAGAAGGAPNEEGGADSGPPLECDVDSVVAGPLVITTQAELRELRGIARVDGDLSLTTTLSDLSSLGCLTRVAGSLTIGEERAVWTQSSPINPPPRPAPSQLRNLHGLEKLARVDQDMWIIGNASLENVDALAHLTFIGGSLSIGNVTYWGFIQTPIEQKNPKLTSLQGFRNLSQLGGGLSVTLSAMADLDGLQQITSAGSVSVKQNPELVSTRGLDGLSSVAGSVRIWNNPALLNLDGLEHLSQVGAELSLTLNASLIDTSALSSVTRTAGVSISDNAALAALAGLNQLQQVDGGIYLGYNRNLKTLSAFASLRGVKGTLSLVGNQLLASLGSFSTLESVGGDLQIRGNALSNLVGLGNLVEIGGNLVFDGTPPFGNPGLKTLQGLEKLAIVRGSLIIEGNSQLEDLEGLQNLEQTEWVNVSDNPSLTSLGGLRGLKSLGFNGLKVEKNASLTSLGLVELTTCGAISLTENATLRNVDGLDKLTSVSNWVQLDGEFQHVDGLRGLENVGGTLAVLGAVADLGGLSHLKTAGDVILFANTTATDVLDSLTTVTGSVEFGASSGDKRLAKLKTVGGDFRATFYDALTSFAAPTLVSVGGTLKVTTIPAASALAPRYEFPSLVSVDELVLDYTELANVDGFSHLARIESSLEVEENHRLSNLDGFASLTYIGSNFVIDKNPLLRHLRGLDALPTVKSFSIQNNAVLPTCEAERLRAHFTPPATSSQIAGNDDQGTCPVP